MLKTGADYFASANLPKDQRYHWAGITKHYHNAMQALIAAAEKDPEKKVIGHRIKNNQRNDEILHYLFKSRNAEDHPEDGDESAGSSVVPNSIGIPGIIDIADGTAFFTNCRYEVDGAMIDLHGSLGVEDRMPFAQFRNSVPLHVKREAFCLQNVKDKQGKPYPVPGAKGDDYVKARGFAAHCISVLEKFAKQVWP